MRATSACPHSRRNRRFLSSVPHLTDAMLDHLVDDVDGIDHVALAFVVLDDDNLGTPVGVARMIRYTDRPTAADLAVTVRRRLAGPGRRDCPAPGAGAGAPGGGHPDRHHGRR